MRLQGFLDRPAVRGAMIVVGVLLMACSYNFFFIPEKIAPGGFSGIGTVLYYRFGLPVGGVTILLNIPVFALALREKGWGYILRSLVAMAGYSVLVDMLPVVSVTGDVLLAMVYGSVLLGVGLGLIIRADCTTGGTDMLAQLISERVPRLSFGMALGLLEGLVVLLTGFTFGPTLALYATLAILLSSKLIDMIQEGLHAAKAFLIITRQGDAIARRIMAQMERGVTEIQGKGMYSGEGKQLLLCVIQRSEMAEIKKLVHEEDPDAFVIVSDVNEAMGEGFKPLAQLRVQHKKGRSR